MPDRAASNLAAVPGITVGHWTDPAGATGCTVVLAPAGGMRAAAVARGRATGTRELDALDPRHLVEAIHAVLLTGGSAYGLGAADGVMRWLRARGRGLPVGRAGVVPIVPTAVIFDLGNTGQAVRWPTPDDAERACEAAGTAFAEGSVGAGTGATVGKAAGLAGMMKGGLGSWAVQSGEVIVGALVVVNAVGDVRDAHGAILAGARDAQGVFLDAQRYLAEGGAPLADRGGGGSEGGEGDEGGRDDAGRGRRNTTLAVVATNAAVDRIQLQALAQASNDALARRITPFGTLFDGDITFAVSSGSAPTASPLQVEALAAEAVPEALERAVRLARGTPAVPGLADRKP
jgi:L-aminopeptidase/D-esterase-like protein